MESSGQVTMLHLVNTEDHIREFAAFTLKFIEYMDYITVNEEIERMKKASHIVKYWIMWDKQKIGTVKLSLFHFFDLALKNQISEEILLITFRQIEEKLTSTFTGKIHGHILSKYLPIALQADWNEEYSRYQMSGDLREMKIVKYDDLDSKEFDYSYLPKLADLFIDAYAGSRDEEIGMMTRGTVEESLNDIMSGKYGVLVPELSILVFGRWGKLIGASLITLSEGSAFLVIIGVRKKQQNHGLGRKMMSFNIERCLAAGYTSMKLWVTEDIPAHSFYKSLGFKDLTKVSAIYKTKIA